MIGECFHHIQNGQVNEDYSWLNEMKHVFVSIAAATHIVYRLLLLDLFHVP